MDTLENDPLFRGWNTDALPQRIAEVLGTLRRHQEGLRCDQCGGRRCGHDVLMSMVLGYKAQPMCRTCLAAMVERDPDILAAELGAFILSKECLRVGWAWVGIREKNDPDTACSQEGLPRQRNGAADAADSAPSDPPRPDADWDAGDMACGDLVLQLRIRMRAIQPRQILKVTARDPGAGEDLPAWCRLTGHTMLAERHPDYWIRKKEE